MVNDSKALSDSSSHTVCEQFTGSVAGFKIVALYSSFYAVMLATIVVVRS